MHRTHSLHECHDYRCKRQQDGTHANACVPENAVTHIARLTVGGVGDDAYPVSCWQLLDRLIQACSSRNAIERGFGDNEQDDRVNHRTTSLSSK